MAASVFLSRILGTVRDAVVAAKFGAAGETDAFFAAFTIPDWLNYLLAGGTLSITLLPIYAGHLTKGDENAANRALSTVTSIVLVLALLGVVAGQIFAETLLAAFFSKMPADKLATCVAITRVLLPAQIFFVAGGLMSATLFARGHFRAAAAAPLLYNGGIIAGGLLLGDQLGIAALAWGALFGAFAGPFLVPTIAAVRAGARLFPRFAGRDPDFLAWIKQSLPLMLGVSLVTADEWILRYFASGDEGAISHLTYAKRLMAAPIAMVGQAVGQASMPFFTRLFAEGKRGELADTVLATVRGAGVVAMMAAAGMIAVAEPLTALLFQRGAYTAADVGPTASYLVIFAAAVPLWALQGLLVRAFYAARDTLTPMLAGTVVTVLSLPLYDLAYRRGGAAGLAVASGVGIFLHTTAVVVLLRRLLPELGQGAGACALGLGRGAVVAIVAGLAAHAAASGAARIADLALVRCAAGGVAFAAVVLLVAGPLGVPEPGRLVARLFRRARRAT